MAALTTKVKPFIIQSIVDALQNANPASWVASTQYSLGAQTTSAGNVYACTQSGVSGTSGPQATGLVADGSCIWLYLRNAKSPSNINANLYVGLGRTAAWPNDAAPPAPDTSDAGLQGAIDSTICLLEMTSAHARLGLLKNIWTTGTVYTAYAGVDGDPNGYTSISTGDIYKCLDNNLGTASTVAPSGQSVTPFSTSDGYVWKYMGTANGNDITNFGTTEFIPIQVATASGLAQYDVQTGAVPGEISSFGTKVQLGTGSITTETNKILSYSIAGALATPTSAAVVSVTMSAGAPTHIFTTTPGAGYGAYTWAFVYDQTATDGGCLATANLASGALSSVSIGTVGTAYTQGALAFVIGDGTGATASVVLDATLHTVNSITVGAAGSGYTWAKIVIIPGVVAYEAPAIMGPALGHGANIVTELGANGLLLSYDITSTLSPYVQSTFTYRQVSLISSVSPVAGYGSNYFGYVGPDHASWNGGLYSSSDPYKYNTASGEVLYLNNITPVSHTISNEEIIKISISF